MSHKTDQRPVVLVLEDRTDRSYHDSLDCALIKAYH